VEDNNLRVDRQADLYRQRQAIVEHPFGTIKRGWGYSYTLLRGLRKVNGEMALIFLCYNLRRSLSILGLAPLVEQLGKGKLATVPALWRRISAHSRFWWRDWFAAAEKLLSGRAGCKGLQCFTERYQTQIPAVTEFLHIRPLPDFFKTLPDCRL
jgi:hypothetical protein